MKGQVSAEVRLLRIIAGLIFSALPILGASLFGWLFLTYAEYQWWGWAIGLALVLLSGFLARPIFRVIQQEGILYFITVNRATPELDVTEEELKRKSAALKAKTSAKKNQRRR